MPPQRFKEKFQQLTEFERDRNIGLLEGEFFYLTIAGHVQQNRSTEKQVWKQRADEHRTTRKTGGGGWKKVTSMRENRQLLHKTVNNRITPSSS